ncbi:hypothetical protein RQP46_009006 [Phenoliferia psychrophenolica]
MQEKTASGVIIGCLSACMAGINAGTNSNNCCSGTMDDRDKCLQTGVDHYDYFKAGCTHAYAFPPLVHHYFLPRWSQLHLVFNNFIKFSCGGGIIDCEGGRNVVEQNVGYPTLLHYIIIKVS